MKGQILMLALSANSNRWLGLVIMKVFSSLDGSLILPVLNLALIERFLQQQDAVCTSSRMVLPGSFCALPREDAGGSAGC